MNDEHEHKVKGRITRLYPAKGRIYFHTEGDQHPYGYAESDYNFVEVTEATKELVGLLYKAAEHKWRLDVVRHPDHKDGNFWKVEEVWVEFVFKEDALFNAV